MTAVGPAHTGKETSLARRLGLILAAIGGGACGIGYAYSSQDDPANIAAMNIVGGVVVGAIIYGLLGVVIGAVIDRVRSSRRRRRLLVDTATVPPARPPKSTPLPLSHSRSTTTFGTQSRREPTVAGSAPQKQFATLADIRQAAHADPGAREILRAIQTLERRGPMRHTEPIDGWCFADGAYCLLFRLGSTTYAANGDQWTRLGDDVNVTAYLDADGLIVRARVGSLGYTNLRPANNAEDLLEATGGMLRIVLPDTGSIHSTQSSAAVEASDAGANEVVADVPATSEMHPLLVSSEPMASVGRYSTLEWTTNEVREVRSALTDRGIEFQILRGWLLTDPKDHPFIDRIISERVNACSQTTASSHP